MFLTETDFINAKLMAEGAMNESDIVKYIVNNDINSIQKKKMQEGEKYYNGEQEILQKDFRRTRILETGETGEEYSKVFQNDNRSNHKNVNAFLKILVEQKTAYLVSREATISVTGAEKDNTLKEYETMLCDFADDTFNEVLQDLVTGASCKGFEVIHVYKGSFNIGKQSICIVKRNQNKSTMARSCEKESVLAIFRQSQRCLPMGSRHRKQNIG